MNPIAASVFRWYGDSRFYKTPGLKAALVGVSACSVLYRLLATRASPRWLLWAVRMWACPSAGVWLVAVLILISCRPLERQLGGAKFAVSSIQCTVCSHQCLVVWLLQPRCILVPITTVPYLSPVEHYCMLRYVVVGSLAWLYGTTVYPLHCYHPLPLLPISSNTLLYLLIALFGCSSLPTVVLTLCGVVGAGVQSLLGPFPLPSPPSWLSTCASHLFETEGLPPAPLSGATLAIQREQYMDQLEHMILHHNRLRFDLHTRLRRRPHPSQDQVQQLVAMGFTQSEAEEALVAMGNDTAAAIQFLTSRNHPINS